MQDYDYLKEDMRQGFTYHNELRHKVILTTITLWGGALVILTALNKDGAGYMEDIFSFFALITVFFISIVLLYFSSKIYRTNIDIVHKNAAYLIIFHEERPKTGTKRDERRFWELSLFELMGRQSKGKDNHILQRQQFVLSLIAFFMEVIFFIFVITRFCMKKGDVTHLDWLVGSVCLLWIVISVYLLPKICKNTASDANVWYSKKKKYLRNCIDYAIESEYDTKDGIIEKFGEKFWKKIMEEDTPATV